MGAELGENGPVRRILSLDGGGVRGLVSIGFLERLESLIAERQGRGKARLTEHFDLMGGTSTGAVIAAALSLGYSAAEVRDFYLTLVPKVFRRSWWRVAGLQSRFEAKHLATEIAGVAGDRRLESPDIETGLAIVMKRLDSGAVWVVTNCKESQFWEDPPDRRFVGNRHYRLLDLLRASTAAPGYFAPQSIKLFAGEAAGLFVDGGVSPHNNPALLLLQVAAFRAYGWRWPLGPERLKLVSIGAGSFRQHIAGWRRYLPAARVALTALVGMIADNSQQVLTTLQWLGRAEAPWVVNSELGDLSGETKPAPLFSFWRWDARVDGDWLAELLGRPLSDRDLKRLRRLDDPSVMTLCHEIGCAAAERQITRESIDRLLTDRSTSVP